jgi:hypothetical protein
MTKCINLSKLTIIQTPLGKGIKHVWSSFQEHFDTERHIYLETSSSCMN